MRAKTLVALTMVVAFGAVGCSSGSEEAPADAAVEIDHAFGTTVLDTTPERIVATSSQWVDVLLEFDVQPVAYMSAGTMGDGRGLYPWQQEVSPEAAQLDAGNSMAGIGPLPAEEIATYTPDLILGNWQIDSQEDYDLIAKVAPTVAPLGDTGVDRWDEQLRAVGAVLGRSDDAERIIAERTATIDEAALPGLEGKTAVLSQYMVPQQQLVVVADPDDGAATLFEQLGMTLPPSLVEEAGVTQGRLMLSPERVDALVADLLVILPNGGTADELTALPGFDRLPSVVGGGLAVVDYPTVVAFNTPSSLSITYALDAIAPQLEAVAGA